MTILKSDRIANRADSELISRKGQEAVPMCAQDAASGQIAAMGAARTIMGPVELSVRNVLADMRYAVRLMGEKPGQRILVLASPGFIRPSSMLAVLADKRDGESVAVRMKADAPGQDGVRRRILRGELLLDAGFGIDRDQPLNGVLRRPVPVKIERNERQRCLIKNAGSWRIWSRSEPEKRRNHSGATTGPR